MLYHIIAAGESGVAFVKRVVSAVPGTFSAYSLWPGQPCMVVTYADGREENNHPYQITENPEILDHLAGDFFRVKLSPAALAALPHVVKGK